MNTTFTLGWWMLVPVLWTLLIVFSIGYENRYRALNIDDCAAWSFIWLVGLAVICLIRYFS